MLKAKEVSVVNLVLFLVASMAISAVYFVSRPQVVSTRSLPVFMGEEVLIQKAAKTVTAMKTGAAEKVITAQKAVSLPVPQPQAAAPLPIVPPVITFKVLPFYPVSALEKGEGGSVLLSVYVGLTGQPEKVETKISSGVAELDDSALKAVSQWKFSPATQGGSALSSWFEVPVRFEIN